MAKAKKVVLIPLKHERMGGGKYIVHSTTNLMDPVVGSTLTVKQAEALVDNALLEVVIREGRE